MKACFMHAVPCLALAVRAYGALAAIASISTSAPGSGRATTWMAVRVGVRGCSAVAKNSV